MLALGGVVGPVGFISAWIVGAILAGPSYSSIDDAISRLAAAEAETRMVMNAGFVVFGVALPCYALALRETLSGWAWMTAASTGLATLGVAALPLDVSDSVDQWHGVAAGIGYVTLALTPFLAFRPLRSRHHDVLAFAGIVAGVTSALCLALSIWAEANGFFQRLGLTATDTWLIASVPTLRALLQSSPYSSV